MIKLSTEEIKTLFGSKSLLRVSLKPYTLLYM
jgi:hypothetical protein